MTSAREAIHNLIDILLESPGTFNNLSESHEANATTLEVELDHQIKRLIKSSEAINREIDHRLKVLRQHRNQSFSPLYRLPNEIIARIFEETLIQRKRIGVDSGPFLQDLGTLSRRCRQVVTNHPTLGDTVSEDLGKKFRFRASTDTCEELKITSDHENFATFHGLHGDQHEPTTYHIKSCNIPVHFKQILARALEGPLAPHNFSSLRSLTLCATTHRDLKPIPSICTVFLYNVPTLEKLSLVGLYAAADNVVHCLISHLNGYSESETEVCFPNLEHLELLSSHVRRDLFLALVEHRVNNTSIKRLKMEESSGLASIDTVLLIEQLIGRENFDWDGYKYLDEDWGSEGSVDSTSEASTTDKDTDGSQSMSAEDEDEDQDEWDSQDSDSDSDNEDNWAFWDGDSDAEMPRWHGWM